MFDQDEISDFLQPVLDMLDDNWTHRLEEVPPVGFGVVLESKGVPGRVAVTPCMISEGVIHFGLGERGKPHYQLYTYDANDDIADIIRTCDPKHLHALLQGWRASQVPAAERLNALPMRDKECSHLATIAAGLATPVEVSLDFDPQRPTFELSSEGKETLGSVLAVLDIDRLAQHFPRQDDGRLRLSTHVLLAELPGTHPLGKGRAIWLHAASPQRRADGSQLRLRITDFIGENSAYRWNEAKWMFCRNAEPPALERALLDLWAKSAVQVDDENVMRAMQCVHLLGAGQFQDAFALYGIKMGESVRRALSGAPLNVHDAYNAQAWAQALRRVLWECAPWSILELLNREHQRLCSSRAERRGRSMKTLQLRMVTLPHQHHQRKAGLTLTQNADGQATLDLCWSATNARVPECHWKRPLAMDLLRFNLHVPAPSMPGKLRTEATLEKKPADALAVALRGRRYGDLARARKLARSRSKQSAIQELLPLCEQGKLDERRNALNLYRELASPEDAAPIVELLSDSSSYIRIDALAILRRLRYSLAINRVARVILDETDRMVRIDAVTTLKALSPQATRSVRALLHFMQSEDPLLRQAACTALLEESRGVGSLADALHRLQDDPDPTVAAAARKAIQYHEIVRG